MLSKFKRNEKLHRTWILAVLIAAAMLMVCEPSFAAAPQQKTFASAEEAVKALITAAKDNNDKEVLSIFGPSGKELIFSGDTVADKRRREEFIKTYDEKNKLVQEGDNFVLVIGKDDWPFPIPLVSTNGAWRFDSDTGKNEILFRTIGENEATAILVCDDFASARKQHNASESANDPVAVYAQNLISLTNSSASKTTGVPEKTSHLFHGYNFQAGKDTARVPLIAYPAKYRSSGVMTFLVTKSGVVYEKDLGPDTNTVAPKIGGNLFDSSWHRAE